jgi:hypothetical protein
MVGLCNVDKVFFCEIGTGCLSIIYIHLRPQKVKTYDSVHMNDVVKILLVLPLHPLTV